MRYEGLVVVDLTTGEVVGGYPHAGRAAHHTRLGMFYSDDEQDYGTPAVNDELTKRVMSGGYAIVRVTGKVG